MLDRKSERTARLESADGSVCGEQLLKTGTSVAAIYRAARRAYTRPLFVSKLAIAAEEIDEAEFWLRVIVKTKLSSPDATANLMREAGELAAIFTASVKTARGGRLRRQSNNSTQC